MNTVEFNSEGKAAIVAAGSDPVAIALALRKYFPELASSKLNFEQHVQQIRESQRFVEQRHTQTLVLED
jgi:hypothetical protein